MRKRRKKKTSGSRLVAFVLLLLIPALHADKKKKTEPYGLVAGSVFREPGLALPGASVTLMVSPESDSAQSDFKKLSSSTDIRGEFAFRVPVVQMRYSIHAAARGYQAQEKLVSVHGDGRVDVTFVLAPESK